MSKWSSRYSEMIMATRNGTLPKAKDMRCEKCGAQANERHHEDYKKPLQVIFLCHKCHVAIHQALGDLGKPLYYNFGAIPVGLHAVIHDAKQTQISACVFQYKNRPQNRGMNFKCFSWGKNVVVFRTK